MTVNYLGREIEATKEDEMAYYRQEHTDLSDAEFEEQWNDGTAEGWFDDIYFGDSSDFAEFLDDRHPEQYGYDYRENFAAEGRD